MDSLADLLRTFADQNGVQVADKALHNRLARAGFEAFIRGMCERLLDRLRIATLAPEGERAAALREVFPGRFTTIEPAAVEIHATYNGCADEVQQLHVAPDATADAPSPGRRLSRVVAQYAGRDLSLSRLREPATWPSAWSCSRAATWASLCSAILKRFLAHVTQQVGQVAISTRRVAMCAHLILDTIVHALLRGRHLWAALQQGVAFLSRMRAVPTCRASGEEAGSGPVWPSSARRPGRVHRRARPRRVQVMLKGNDAGHQSVGNAKAVAAGLGFRPVEPTLRDTLAWWPSVPDARRAAPRFEIPVETEARALAAGRARK